MDLDDSLLFLAPGRGYGGRNVSFCGPRGVDPRPVSAPTVPRDCDDIEMEFLDEGLSSNGEEVDSGDEGSLVGLLSPSREKLGR